MNGNGSSTLETSFVQVKSYAPASRYHDELAASLEGGTAAGDEQAQLQNASEMMKAVEQQCLELIAVAQQEAETILQNAKEEAEEQSERLRTEATERGFSEGLEAGRNEARLELQRALDVQVSEARELIANAREHRMNLVQDIHKPITHLVMTSVQRLIQRELTVEPADVHRIVEELLTHVYDSMWVEVRVNPQDYKLTVDNQPSWQTAVGGKWDLAVIPDARVAVGGCEIRSEMGRIDATMETKLELLDVAIAELVKQGVKDYVGTMD
jgi:flagellar assembly protein FliH